MSRPLPFRASINAAYATFFKEPVRFTLLALPVPAGSALCFVFAAAMADRMVEDGINRGWQAVGAFALQYAIFILCMGAQIDGARQVRDEARMQLKKALTAAFARLLEMFATSLPILATGLLLLYSAIAFSSPAWMLAGLVAILLDMTFLALSMPICLIERRGPLASIGRSVSLTRGSRLRFLAAVFVAQLPIGLSVWIFRLMANALVGVLITILITAWDMVAVSILSVVALEMLSEPSGETLG